MAFAEVPEEEAVDAMTKHGISRLEAEESVRSLRGNEHSPYAIPHPDVVHLTGRPPRTFREWAKDNVDAFSQATG